MVVAMFVGVVVLGVPAGWALGAVCSGWAELRDDAPAAMLSLMAITMTVAAAASWSSAPGCRLSRGSSGKQLVAVSPKPAESVAAIANMLTKRL